MHKYIYRGIYISKNFMSSSIYDLPSDVGKTLSELRKIAKKKQADIAASINVAQSHISRIEKEKVTPTSQEIEGYINAVGTKEAKDYLAFLKPWKILKRLTQLFLGEVMGLAITWLLVGILTGMNAHKLRS